MYKHCLNHNFFMGIALVVTFSGYGAVFNSTLILDFIVEKDFYPAILVIQHFGFVCSWEIFLRMITM